MMERGCSGDYQDVGRAMEEPRKCNLHRRSIEARCRFRQVRRLQWAESPEWKERNVGDTVASEVRDQCIVGPMCEVVVILDADDWDDLSRLRNLRLRYVA